MRKFSLFFLAVLFFYGCHDEILQEVTGGPEVDAIYGFSEDEVVKGHIRIKLKEEPTGVIGVRSSGGEVVTGIRALDSSATTLGITRIERVFPHAGKYEERSRREGLHLWYDVWFSEEVASTRAAGQIAITEEIDISVPVVKVISSAIPAETDFSQYVTQVFSVNGDFIFNDPFLPLQWGFDNRGEESWQEEGADIRITDVWKEYTGHPDIIVSIVDGGIDLTNPDIQGNLWINPGEIAGNGTDDDGNGYVDDVYGYNFYAGSPTIVPHRHGTHVAGTIGAVNHNDVGVAGIAGGDGTPNSGVKLMSCQIFEHTGTSETSDYVAAASNIAAAIKYGADNGAVISQNSWGYAVGSSSTRSSYVDPTHKAAIDYFFKYAGCDNNGDQLPDSPMKGGIVLFAAGNANSSNPRVSAPADYEKVLGVAAIGPDYKKGSYSNYGEFIDISAPGGAAENVRGIYSTTTQRRGYYEYRYGTSMACPHVAGVAALVIQKFGVGKPGFTARQLEEILLKTAYGLNEYNPDYIGMLGEGCVDATAALAYDIEEDLSDTLELTDTATEDGKLGLRGNMELAGDVVVTIRNSIGSKVMTRKLTLRRFVTSYIDVSGLATGYYTLECKYEYGTIKKNFIKY